MENIEAKNLPNGRTLVTTNEDKHCKKAVLKQAFKLQMYLFSNVC